MTNETEFQEKLQQGYVMLTSNLKELHDKDQQQLEQAMIGCKINDAAPEQNRDDSFDQAKLQDKMQKLCMILSMMPLN
ncbi:unnamed protein product [Absidia cylindrospora]